MRPRIDGRLQLEDEARNSLTRQFIRRCVLLRNMPSSLSCFGGDSLRMGFYKAIVENTTGLPYIADRFCYAR